MRHIVKEFTYNIADDQYYQTNDQRKTASVTYEGPEKQYVIVDATTNKLTGEIVLPEQYETYNENNDEYYAVEVDCNTDTLICSLVGLGINEDAHPNISEDIPGCEVPYTRDDPVMPDHTYERTEIEYDRSSGRFITPYPWKQPYVTWEDRIRSRNISLAAADRLVSEDLPTALYDSVIEYKQYLRDFTETFGAAFSITIATAGSGYSVGDRLLISDPVYKNNSPADDILVTVQKIDDNGGIVEVTKTNTRAYEYHPDAGSYNDVFFTTSSTGTGASFNLSKVKTVDPWKITPKEAPLG